MEDSTFKFSNNGIQYSLNGGTTWNSLAANTNTPTVTTGNKILWRGALTPVNVKGIGTFSSTGKFNAQGNTMSLLYGDEFRNKISISDKDSAFVDLFRGCNTIINAENLLLPALTLSFCCYSTMFFHCTSLVTAPALPATTLTGMCYGSMFNGCTSLITAPDLFAPIWPNVDYYGCCTSMFMYCSSLKYIKCLTTQPTVDPHLLNWVSGVSSSGTFVKAKGISWPTGKDGIPSGWTVKEAEY